MQGRVAIGEEESREKEKENVCNLYLCGLVLTHAHRVLLVEGAARVELVHLDSLRAVTHYHCRRVCRYSLHRTQLRVAGTASLHVVGVDGGVVACEALAPTPIVGLVDRRGGLKLVKFCIF